MNKVFLRGNVGVDPTVHDFANGGKVAQFTLATKERGFTTRDGNQIPDVTDWHNIVVKQSGLANVVQQYVKKGMSLLVVGKLRTRSYQDNAGQTRYVTEVIVDEMELLDRKPAQSQSPAAGYDNEDFKW